MGTPLATATRPDSDSGEHLNTVAIQMIMAGDVSSFDLPQTEHMFVLLEQFEHRRPYPAMDQAREIGP